MRDVLSGVGGFVRGGCPDAGVVANAHIAQ
jgi:hypothetical protein